MKKTCKQCVKEFDTNSNKKLFCNLQCKNLFTSLLNKEKRKKIINCVICSTEFHKTNGKLNTCSPECKTENRRRNQEKNYQNQKNKKAEARSLKYENADPYTYVECAVCGYRGGHISTHIIAEHNMTTEEYKEKYNSPLVCQETADSVKGNKNPAYQHGGKFSPYSEKFVKYKNLNEKETREKIKHLNDHLINLYEEEPERSPLKKEYYLVRGFSEKESEDLLKERQQTFSLDICIKKHGETEGKRIWEERQKKWQDTLKTKPQEEIDDINRRKISPGRNISIAEQEIVDYLRDKGLNIKQQLGLKGENRNCYYDINYENKIIEYNGTYWHQDNRFYSPDNPTKIPGVTAKDKWELDRQKIILAENNGYKVMVVWEHDYSQNKEEMKEKCLSFLTK